MSNFHLNTLNWDIDLKLDEEKKMIKELNGFLSEIGKLSVMFSVKKAIELETVMKLTEEENNVNNNQKNDDEENETQIINLINLNNNLLIAEQINYLDKLFKKRLNLQKEKWIKNQNKTFNKSLTKSTKNKINQTFNNNITHNSSNSSFIFKLYNQVILTLKTTKLRILPSTPPITYTITPNNHIHIFTQKTTKHSQSKYYWKTMSSLYLNN